MKQRSASKKTLFIVVALAGIVVIGIAYVVVGATVLKRVPKEQPVVEANSQKSIVGVYSHQASDLEPVAPDEAKNNTSQGQVNGNSTTANEESANPGAPALHLTSVPSQSAASKPEAQKAKSITDKVQNVIQSIL